MRWPKFSISKFGRLIRKNPTPSGVSCTYIHWSKTVGLKTYTERRQRDRCWKAQARAAQAGLGPKVGRAFEFEIISACHWGSPDFSSRKIYCYWTEHAATVRYASDDDWDRLREDLRSVGILHTDLYARNAGRIKGRLVCVDFDSASCRLVKKPKRKKPKRKKAA